MGRLSRVVYVLAALVIALCGTAAVPAPDSIQKLPVPETTAQHAARSRIDGTFKEEIAKAKKPGEKSAVAKKLLQTADETTNDTALKYVALLTARDLALSDSDAETAISAITGLETFAIDGIKLRTDALIAIMKSTGSPQDALVGPLVEQTIAADRFAVARQLSEKALATAKSAGDAGAIANAAAWLEEVKEIDSASGSASKAAAILSTKPGDAAACLTVGRFEAFFKNRWDQALPLLASANDATLKNVAKNELAAAGDPAKVIQVADGWWEVAVKERGIAQSHIREHAAHWYKTALPGLTGLEKARAENRVKEGAIVRASYTGWIDLLRKVNIERDTIKGKWSLDRGTLSVGTGAELKIAPKPEKDYSVRVEYARLDAGESGSAILIVLPVAENQVVLSFDANRLGLDILDGKRWFANDAMIKRGNFGGAGKKHLVEVTVRQETPEAKILVLVDGKQQLEWTGAPSRLTSSGDYSLQPPALGIATYFFPLRISGIALREIVDSEPR